MRVTAAHGGATSLAAGASAGSSTVMVAGASAINDQIGFGNPASTKTKDRTEVATFTGSGTVQAGTAGFPTSGQLRVGNVGGLGRWRRKLHRRHPLLHGDHRNGLHRRVAGPGRRDASRAGSGGPALQGHRGEVLCQRLRPHHLSAPDRARSGRRGGQQRRHLPALRDEHGARLRSTRARRHFLLGRLPVGGQRHRHNRQQLPVQPVGHRIQRASGRRRENDGVLGGERGLVRDQLHGVPGSRGGAVRYCRGAPTR